MGFPRVLRGVERYYTGKVTAHGATPRGVDWNSAESQALRFDRLLEVCRGTTPDSLLDFGCGYGALLDHARRQGIWCSYQGFDLSAVMIDKARALHSDVRDATFTTDPAAVAPADYALASGIFNVKLGFGVRRWRAYMLDTLASIASMSVRGFAFNALTAYSDREKMRPDLYYADPLFWFDHCKRRFSRNVALLHDYALFEFTIVVRK